MFLSAFALEYMYQFTITSYGGLCKIAYSKTLGNFTCPQFFHIITARFYHFNINLFGSVMGQSTGEITDSSLRANEISEAISTKIASSPAAPRNDRLVMPPFTDPITVCEILSLTRKSYVL